MMGGEVAVRATMKTLTTMLLIFTSTSCCEAINIGLHAQGSYKNHNWVAGSEITTRGMRKALMKLPNVDKVQLFAPFVYPELLTERWDLLLIEGYTGTVPKVIRILRHLNPDIIILHYCLDTYPSLEGVILKLDVDGFLTNSRTLMMHLQALAPTEYVALAADPEEHRPVPASTSVVSRYDVPVVYLGQYKETKYRLTEMLREAIPFGLAIYGNGWSTADADLQAHWHGILPLGDIAELYSSARVVLGTTEIKQRELGMINNRVFEALSCGALFVSDHFPEVERVCGNRVWYAKEEGDVARHLSTILKLSPEERAANRERGRSMILEKHAYDNRVGTILKLYNRLAADKQRTYRRNRLSVAVVTEAAMLPSYLLQKSHQFNFHVIPPETPFASIVRHDMVIVYGVLCGVSDVKIRDLNNELLYAGKSFAFVSNHGYAIQNCSSGRTLFDLRLYDFIFGEVAPVVDYPALRVIAPSQNVAEWSDELEQAIHGALFGVKARASMSIIDPPPNAVLQVVCKGSDGECSFKDTQSASWVVKVSLSEVSTPADGSWCTVIDQREIACQGDDVMTDGILFPQQLLRAARSNAIDVSIYIRLRDTIDQKIVLLSEHTVVKLQFVGA